MPKTTVRQDLEAKILKLRTTVRGLRRELATKEKCIDTLLADQNEQMLRHRKLGEVAASLRAETVKFQGAYADEVVLHCATKAELAAKTQEADALQAFVRSVVETDAGTVGRYVPGYGRVIEAEWVDGFPGWIRREASTLRLPPVQ